MRCWSNFPQWCRTKPVDLFADGKVESGGSNVLSCTKGRLCCFVAGRPT